MWRRRLSALLPRSPCSSIAPSSYQQHHRHILLPTPNEKPLALNLLRLFTSLSGNDGARPFIAFILGGPGSGKGTQCSRIASDFGFAHVSAGDLLRDEIASGTEKGEDILEIIKEGRIVPSEVTVELIRKAIESSTAKRVLIDGFPRCEENRIAFEKLTGTEPDLVIFFDCPEDLMVKRLLSRNQTNTNPYGDLAMNYIYIRPRNGPSFSTTPKRSPPYQAIPTTVDRPRLVIDVSELPRHGVVN